MRYAAGAIPTDQLHALQLWIAGESFAEIAVELKLASAPEAERLVRAALERLRRQYRDPQGRAS